LRRGKGDGLLPWGAGGGDAWHHRPPRGRAGIGKPSPCSPVRPTVNTPAAFATPVSRPLTPANARHGTCPECPRTIVRDGFGRHAVCPQPDQGYASRSGREVRHPSGVPPIACPGRKDDLSPSPPEAGGCPSAPEDGRCEAFGIDTAGPARARITSAPSQPTGPADRTATCQAEERNNQLPGDIPEKQSAAARLGVAAGQMSDFITCDFLSPSPPRRRAAAVPMADGLCAPRVRARPLSLISPSALSATQSSGLVFVP